MTTIPYTTFPNEFSPRQPIHNNPVIIAFEASTKRIQRRRPAPPPANREGNPAVTQGPSEAPLSRPLVPRPPRLTLCGDWWCWLWLRVLLGEGVGEGVPTPLWAGCGVVGAEVAGVMVFCRSARRASGKKHKQVHISLTF